MRSVKTRDGDEWYTPEYVIKPIREFLGGIDLDPCSSDVAQRVVQAEKWYTKERNCLHQPWACRVLFMNPPYSDPKPFVERFRIHYGEDKVIEKAIVLVNNATSTTWFRTLAQLAKGIYFPKRINFYHLEAPNLMSNRHSQAILWFDRNGTKIEEFKKMARQIGPGFVVTLV